MEQDYGSVRESLYGQFPDLRKLKKNPNGWPIIKKYNRKIFNKYKYDIFKIIEATIDERMTEYYKNWSADELRQL